MAAAAELHSYIMPDRCFLPREEGQSELLTRDEEYELAGRMDRGIMSLRLLQLALPPEEFGARVRRLTYQRTSVPNDAFIEFLGKHNLMGVVEPVREISGKEKKPRFVGFALIEGPLPALERDELLATAADGKEAFDIFVYSNLRWALKIAHKHVGHNVAPDDLIQEAIIGLMTAVAQFEPDKGYKFSTYATPWLRQTTGRAIDDQSRTIRRPVHIIEGVEKYRHQEGRLTQEKGRVPTDEEMADTLGMNLEDLRVLKDLAESDKIPLSLDRPFEDEGDEDNQYVVVPEPNFQDPADLAISKVNIAAALSTLTPEESSVIDGRYVSNDLRQQEVADGMGKTRQRVSQIELEALEKLKARAQELGLEPDLE